MTDHRVTAVVLTYNRVTEVMRTIGHLAALPEQPAIIVVDNGSQDGTSARLTKSFPEITVLRLERNIGAAARNAGVQEAATRYVALCDDDTWWATDGSLRRAADVLDQHDRIAVVTAKVLVGPDEREDPTCALMAKSPLHRPAGFPGPSILGFLAGASLVRREAFLEVGGFEPKLFLGGEEALMAYDLAEAGWSMVYLSTALVHHHASPSRDSIGRRRLLLRNALWIAWLRRPFVSACRETWRAYETIRSDPAALPGFSDTLSNVRWLIRRRRVVSPRIEHLIRMVEKQRRARSGTLFEPALNNQKMNAEKLPKGGGRQGKYAGFL
jgi:GT2 family glycosyltransferase